MEKESDAHRRLLQQLKQKFNVSSKCLLSLYEKKNIPGISFKKYRDLSFLSQA